MVEKFSISIKGAIEFDMMQKYLKSNGWKISNMDGFTPQVIVCESNSMLVSYEKDVQTWWNKQTTSTHNFGSLLTFDKTEDYNKIKELVYRDTDLKGFLKFRQLLRCYLIGIHHWTSASSKGEKIDDSNYFTYNKEYCKHCGSWKN